MTLKECAIVECFTGICMCAGEDRKYVYKYLEEKMGRPIYTHEFAMLDSEIKEAAREDFLRLCREARERSKEGGEGYISISFKPQISKVDMVKKVHDFVLSTSAYEHKDVDSIISGNHRMDIVIRGVSEDVADEIYHKAGDDLSDGIELITYAHSPTGFTSLVSYSPHDLNAP